MIKQLMNLHGDTSIYGVCLFVVNALVLDIIDSTITIIEPFFPRDFISESDMFWDCRITLYSKDGLYSRFIPQFPAK